MPKTTTCKPTTRSLYTWEIDEAYKVFASGLIYERVRVHECTTWTNTLDRVGRKLKSMPPANVNNAVTLLNHCFFPIRLLDQPVQVGHPEHYKLGWLIHELTHAWQYQHIGLSYIWLALKVQFQLKGSAYDFEGEEGLKKRRRQEWTLLKFNLEQQGDIARTYYDRLSHGKDVQAWLPYIEEFQKSA